MSYDLIETSVDDAMPVELFQITYSGNTWRYTSADKVITYLTNNYTPIPCSRTNAKSTGDASNSDMTFTFPRDIELADVFRVHPPSEVVSITVFGKHEGDSEFITIWKGRILTPEWTNDGYLKLNAESVFSSLRRPGLRRCYQTQCPHALYSPACGVSRETWKEERILGSVSGLQLYVPSTIGKPNDYYAGGYVTWVNNLNQNIERRMIRSSNGTTGYLTLASVPLALASGQVVTLYPGCDHTLGASGCGRFNNKENHGGMPFFPSKNPFGGSSIY